MKYYEFYTLNFPHALGKKSILTNYSLDDQTEEMYGQDLFVLLAYLSSKGFLIVHIDENDKDVLVYLQRER